MTEKRSIKFALTFPEVTKKDTNLPTTERLAFDDLGDFIEERERIKRLLEKRNESTLKVDYTDFSNHVFFDSAIQKLDVAFDRILNKFPFNGDSEEKDAFFLTGSGYEKYVFDTWPRSVGYGFFDGVDQYVTASDGKNLLHLGSSSLYVSAWAQPVITDQNIVLQVMSASTSPVNKQGYELFFSGATDPHVSFSIYSGSQMVTVSASYASFTSSFNNIAAIYDTNTNSLSLHINENQETSVATSLGSIEFAPTVLLVGSGSQYTDASSSFDFYSGSLDEVRVFHTSSDLYHRKNFSRPVDAEDYLKFRYSFNEGVTGFSNVDNVVIDYSKSGLHGKWLNYASDTPSRVSASVMLSDPGDPILYSFHPDVVSFTSSMNLSASIYDIDNNNNIFNQIAEGVLLVDDETDALLRSFSLALARFFDEIKLYIDQFVNLRITNYDEIDETPDLFLPNLERYFGWKVSEHFNDANPLEFLFGESVLASGSLDIPLVEIRNQFWRRTLNNLPLLMKSKGTRSNIAHFFNVLGLNKENVAIKEYGYLPGTSIQDERIAKTRVERKLGIGTGSLGSISSSFVESPSFFAVAASDDPFTVETMMQLPYVSASYSGSLLTGSLWEMTGSGGFVSCYWIRNSLIGDTGKFVLSSSVGDALSSSLLSVFDGDFIHVAAGANNATGSISVRKVEDGDVTLREDFSGNSFTVPTTTYKFVAGANSSSFPGLPTQGFFGEARLWQAVLSSSELDDHVLNYQSVGREKPLATPDDLLLHWALNENEVVDVDGEISNITDLSRNSRGGTGRSFAASIDPYDKFLLEYNYLSPTVDLKWTENKIRIRNATELFLKDQATDTNEVSLEFSLVDALNEDIVKIFSTLDELNNLIGQPIFKYRGEYSDLEGVRSQYFARLGDTLNFSRFFSLFKWFDRKVSNAIKQLLPARTKFIGGEQVVESHLLERSKYKYHYPIFRTPQNPPEAVVDASGALEGDHMKYLEGDILARDPEQQVLSNVYITSRPSAVTPVGDCTRAPKSSFGSGDFRKHRNDFFPIKVSGDTESEINNPDTGVNFRNETARKALSDRDRDNE